MNNQELLQLYRSFHLLGDAHILKILYKLDSEGEQTFSELRDGLGINPRTLSSKLTLLKNAEFVSADRTHDRLRVYYSLHLHQRGIKRILDAYERFASELN